MRRFDARGQATAEFALLIPLLVLFVLLIVQLVVVGRHRVQLIDQCRSAARILMVQPELPGAEMRSRLGWVDSAPTLAVVAGQPGSVGRVTCIVVDPTDVAMVGPLVPSITLEESMTFLVEGPEGLSP